MAIQIKNLEQLKIMRRAGLVVAQIHVAIREAIKPGMTTDALDVIAAAVIKRGGATSNFLNYHGFPATICVSINDEIVHGIPGPKVINDGDVNKALFAIINKLNELSDYHKPQKYQMLENSTYKSFSLKVLLHL